MLWIRDKASTCWYKLTSQLTADWVRRLDWSIWLQIRPTEWLHIQVFEDGSDAATAADSAKNIAALRTVNAASVAAAAAADFESFLIAPLTQWSSGGRTIAVYTDLDTQCIGACLQTDR